MSREILFRGMISMGDMMEGSLLINGDKTTIMDRSLVFGYGVDPKTVGQYTGLKDKNGVKIFEGDIISMPNFSVKIQYLTEDCNGEKCAGFGWVKIGEENVFYLIDDFMSNVGKVIGNIHQNPELL